MYILVQQTDHKSGWRLTGKKTKFSQRGFQRVLAYDNTESKTCRKALSVVTPQRHSLFNLDAVPFSIIHSQINCYYSENLHSIGSALHTCPFGNQILLTVFYLLFDLCFYSETNICLEKTKVQKNCEWKWIRKDY